MSGGYHAVVHKETKRIDYLGNKAGQKKFWKANKATHFLGYTGPGRKVGDTFGSVSEHIVKVGSK